MKKILTLLVLILFAMQLALAQKTTVSNSVSSKTLHNFYMQRSKTKTIIGIALLIAGVSLANEQHKINEGQIQSLHSLSGGTQSNGYDINKKSWLLNWRKAMIFASIPFFISAGRYKEQAKR